jgi:hypothetical protein
LGDPRSGIELISVDRGHDKLRHAGRSAVSVVHGVAKQRAAGIKQAEVDSPRVDADAG